MSGSVTGEIRAEPNLTPLLDVVFQLITFFMLVFKISGDNYDQRVRLPVAGSVRPIENASADEDRLVLNIDGEGRLLWNGQALGVDEAIKELQTQARLSELNQKIGGKAKPGDPLPTTIVLRADRKASFAMVYRYIQACQGYRFTKFALKAMNAED